MNRSSLRTLASLVAATALLLAACGRSPSPDGFTTLEPASVALSGALFSSDIAAVDQLGEAVALDGATMLVGAPRHDHGANEDGAVYVYDLGVGGWTESAELVHPTPVDDAEFGASVDVLGDLIAVGAPGSDEVFTFAWTGAAWAQQATFASGLAGGFGRSVALAEDLLVVGDDFDDDAGFNAGAVYVYEFNGAVWTQTAKLTGSGSSGGERVGYSVATDGRRIVAGSVFAGEVYVFEHDGVAWTETDALASPSLLNEFGVDVAVQGDTLLVGAPEDDAAFSNAGAVYAYRHNGSSWNLYDTWTASDAESDDQFGGSVALDGDHAVVGALFEDEGGSSAGAAYVFRRSNRSWSEVEKFYAGGTLWLGEEVALSGGWAVAGAPRDATVDFQAGAAYPIDLAAMLPVPLCNGLPATIHPLDPGAGGVVANAAGGFDITGTGAADVIVASDGADAIDALGGDDTICALDGDDDVAAGAGDDDVRGQRGADTIDGGSGDLDELRGGRGADTITDPDGTALLHGGPGADTITVTIAAGWNGGATLFTGLRGGYGDDDVTVDNGVLGITVRISGDELDAPPSPLEGSADVLTLLGQAVDPGSSIIKFP